ncbi:MAG: UDP-N-acetylmuramate--L-alanine ligase [Bacteroidales bacterium]
MKSTTRAIRVMIGGGGTGGHIFPALSIANAIRRRDPDAGIHFVGALGRMEMERVPAAGYAITGLPVRGLKRSVSPANLLVIWYLLVSFYRVWRLLKKFRPDVVVGVGGYASAPLLRVATWMNIPALIQEQNSYAGVTNRWLSHSAGRICVAYEAMERFFPESKLHLTGNPVRAEIEQGLPSREEGLAFLGIEASKRVVLVLGGSLGARTLNRAMETSMGAVPAGVHILWQTGSLYFEAAKACAEGNPGVTVCSFISRMDMAYAAADLVVSRAGAGTISELCFVGKPVVLVPSPNVAEDHQTRNAEALVTREAALLVPDVEAVEQLLPTVLQLLEDSSRMNSLASNIRLLAKPHAADRIADEVFRMSVEAIYFLGIGGIGMSALARYYRYYGCKVYGYDRVETPLTRELAKEGISVHYSDTPSAIPAIFSRNPRRCRVIYTPAIPSTHKELNWFKEAGYPLLKRAAALGQITRSKQGVAIAGTHGKTTISTLTAHLLTGSRLGCDAFLGGISKNYGTNLLLNEASPYVVVEADEFDRSFLQLTPYVALISSTDADHLDIYGSHQQVKEAFSDFANRLVAGGILVVKEGVSVVPPKGRSCYTYSLQNGSTHFHTRNMHIDNGVSVAELITPWGSLGEIRLGVPGRVNMENAVGASAVALLLGVDADSLKQSLSSFAGVKRRFDIHLKEPVLYIDDYAHHPEELRYTLESVRAHYPGRTITAIFQPHLYSRTAHFAAEFAAALSLADTLVLLDIYPARELPMEGVTSSMIFDKVTLSDKYLLSKQEVLPWLGSHRPDVLLTFGAGDIDTLVEPVTAFLCDTFQKT